jgi:prepilin-type N-terminal cleavage/methylation domain-containing protein
MARLPSWYPISFFGGLLTALYSLLPPYIVYIDQLGFLPPSWRIAAGTCMVVVAGLLFICRRKGEKVFPRKRTRDYSARDAFTLVEILIVISILGVIAALILPLLWRSRDSAYTARTQVELRTIAEGTKFLSVEQGGYPADVNRDLPNGLEMYLGPGEWPKAPWPGSVYDWDNWAPSALQYEPKEQVYQISVRFCPLGQPESCTFPNEAWAENFDYYSAYYYCIKGPCRSHSSKPVEHPGYCVNCENN